MVFLLNSLQRGCFGWKHLDMICKNDFPMFVFTLQLKGGLYHNTCLFLFFFLLFSVGLNSSLWSCPALCNASWKGVIELWNDFLSDAMFDSLLFIPLGMFFRMFGGWLLFLLT